MSCDPYHGCGTCADCRSLHIRQMGFGGDLCELAHPHEGGCEVEYSGDYSRWAREEYARWKADQ